MSAKLDWAKPGMPCATVQEVGYGPNTAPIIKRTRVLRVTKTRVVLETDDAFMIATGKRVGSPPSHFGGARWSLYPEGSPELASARERFDRIRINRVAARLDEAGVSLMDVRTVAVHARATATDDDLDLIDRANRLIRIVGDATAPTPEE